MQQLVFDFWLSPLAGTTFQSHRLRFEKYKKRQPCRLQWMSLQAAHLPLQISSSFSRLSNDDKNLSLWSVNDKVVPKETKEPSTIVGLLTKNAGNRELFGEQIEFQKGEVAAAHCHVERSETSLVIALASG